MKPRLTAKVVRGLGPVCAFLEAQANAGDASELFDGLTAAEESDIDAAMRYLSELRKWKQTEGGSSK